MVRIQNPFGWIGELADTAAGWIEDELVPQPPRGEGRPTPGRSTKTKNKKTKNKKVKRNPRRVRQTAPPGIDPRIMGVAGQVPGIAGPGMDINAIAAQMGIDPAMFKGMNPNVGQMISIAMANRGASTMSPQMTDQLVKSLIGDRYSKQESLLGQERSFMEGRTDRNVEGIRKNYDTVLAAQGVAAGRDAEFGKAAVASAQDTTRGIVSALGGEANEGSYVAGAAGQENIGNLNAISAIQNMYNADMVPIIQKEGATAMAAERSAGTDRLRDLSMRLAEMQSERGSAEADLRFNVWQKNNEVLDGRLQTELAIRQANAGLGQQRFANNMGIRSAMLAQQAAQMGEVTDMAAIDQRSAEAQAGFQDKAIDRQFEAAKLDAQERGRNYRAGLSAAGRGKKSGPKAYGATSYGTKESAWNDMVASIEERDLTPQQAIKVAAAVARGYGWSAKNPAVQGLIFNALREAGIDI